MTYPTHTLQVVYNGKASHSQGRSVRGYRYKLDTKWKFTPNFFSTYIVYVQT